LKDNIVIFLSYSFFKIAFVIKNNLLKNIFFQDIKNKPRLNNIYLGVVEQKLENLDSYLIKLDNNNKALLGVKKQKLHVGEKVLVQVIREAISEDLDKEKMPQVSLDISLYTPLVIYKPSGSLNIFSKNLQDKDKALIQNFLAETSKKGYIIRSAYKHNMFNLLQNDIISLENTYAEILKAQTPGLLYSLDFLDQVILQNKSLPNMVVFNSVDDYNKYKLCNELWQVDLYNQKQSILNHFDIHFYEEDVLNSVVELDDQISLTIVEHSAFNYIDVNFKGLQDGSAKEDAFYNANLKVLAKIAQVILLRNLSGQIFVDLLKLHNKNYKNIIQQKLQKLLEESYFKTSVLGFSHLDVLEISRQKSAASLGSSLEENLCYQFFKIIYAIQEALAKNPMANVEIIGNEDLIKTFKQTAKIEIEALQQKYFKTILFKEEKNIKSLKLSLIK
jgi:ribonuclease G